MKTVQLKALFKTLRPYLPGFELVGTAIVERPMVEVLKGFAIDQSSHDKKHFYVWVFILPLYVPRTTISFNLGKRLGDGAGTRWDLEDTSMPAKLARVMQAEKHAFLDAAHDLESIGDLISKVSQGGNINDLEALAYTHILCDKPSCAEAIFQQIKDTADASVAWQLQVIERTAAVQQYSRRDYQASKQLLHEWSLQSCRKLGLI